MPRTCSVPGCKSGYRGPDINVQTFTFPQDKELRLKWIRAIHRSEDFVVTDTSSVCIKHFHEEHINRYSTNQRKKEPVLLKRPHLRDDAVPGIFQNQPHYLSTQAPTTRSNPEERRKAMIERDNEEFELWQVKDKIGSFQDLLENFDSKSLSGFKAEKCHDFLFLYKINATINNIPQISCSLKLFTNLKIQAFVGNRCLKPARFKGFLNKDFECCYWSAFESILSHLASLTTEDVSTFEEDMEELCGHMDIILDKWTPSLTNQQTDENSPKLTKLEFCREQIKLLTCSVPRYTSSLLMWACSLFFAFPSGYTMMRNTKVLTLPHPTHLKRLSADIKCEAGISKEQVTYLTTKYKNMDDHEKVVNLMFDEIHTIPTVESKGGKIIGLAPDNGGSTKVQAFMLSSVFGKKEDVVALFPVNSTDADKLKKMTLKVLQVLTLIGYTVLSLSCDNNKMNRSMYRLLCGGNVINQSIPNPFNESAKIFLLFDTVHLAKCVRNNWLNQKNALQTFLFPLMDNPSVILSASVQDLKNIYFKEKNEILKLAPALSQKVLFPSSLERQNVNIALRLFDEKNIVALEKFAKDCISGTAEFIKIFLPWWCIVNVRAPNTGVHKRDPFRNPIRSTNDQNLGYLEKFANFLKKWRECKIPSSIHKACKSGKLTFDTHFALLHTTETFRSMCKYIFEQFNPHYVLLGKFQTDKIESRFGRYRQMSGCNYHISLAQILESERKLKVMSLLKLRSEKYGDFEITDFSAADDMPEEIFTDVPNEGDFDVCLDKSDEVEISESQGSVLYFLGGYCCHLLLKLVGNCLDCKKAMISDGEFNVDVRGVSKETKEYLSNLSRGGLKKPTAILNEVVCIAYQIFVILISKDFEEKFLKVPSQRGLLKRLILKKLQFIIDLDEECEIEECGRSTKTMLNKVAHTLANIFLNNYVKKMNDEVRQNKKRKLDTFDSSSKGPIGKKMKQNSTKEEAKKGSKEEQGCKKKEAESTAEKRESSDTQQENSKRSAEDEEQMEEVQENQCAQEQET